MLGEENVNSSSVWSSCDEELGVEAVRGDDDRIASKKVSQCRYRTKKVNSRHPSIMTIFSIYSSGSISAGTTARGTFAPKSSYLVTFDGCECASWAPFSRIFPYPGFDLLEKIGTNSGSARGWNVGSGTLARCSRSRY